MRELVIVVIVLAIYFFPSLTAAGRHVPNVGSVVVINLFLGWTLIGWVIALAMAYRDPKPRPVPALPAAEEYVKEHHIAGYRVPDWLGTLVHGRGTRTAAADQDWWKKR